MHRAALAALQPAQQPQQSPLALDGSREALAALAALARQDRQAALPVACQRRLARLLAAVQALAVAVAVVVTAQTVRVVLGAMVTRPRARRVLTPRATAAAVVVVVLAARLLATAAMALAATS